MKLEAVLGDITGAIHRAAGVPRTARAELVADHPRDSARGAIGKTVGMTAFDVIGDVHGHAGRLRGLLTSMGYTERRGVWSHPTRTAVFLGDLIDRGPGQLDTLLMVRSMVAAGSAQIVLGNHEFNAVAYATPHPERDDYCRSHNDKHTSQHEAFLADVTFGSPLHRSIIDWFTTIPLWLDLGGLRVVHACWSADHIEHLEAKTGPGNTLTEQLVIDATTAGTPIHDAVETVLKGPEVHLDGVRYVDKDGHPRDHARLRWWDSEATTLRNGVLIEDATQLHDADGRPIDQLPDRPLTDDELQAYTDPDPVLFGHYWWRKETAEPVNPRATCLDFSVAMGGVLRAYRWDGEDQLDEDKFVEA